MRRTVAAPWAQAPRIGRKGGRDSASAGRGKGRRGEGRDMANGAGIAADPTLTGVWMLRPCGMSGEPSILASVSACFRARCLASCCPVLRPACQRFVTGARAGIRLSLLPGLASTASTEVARMSAALHIRLAETASLCLCRSAADVGLSPFPLPFFRARFLACPVPPCRASPASRLALDRSLLHAVSDRRGDRCHRHPWDRKPPEFESLAAPLSRRSVSRRQVEGALESAF